MTTIEQEIHQELTVQVGRVRCKGGEAITVMPFMRGHALYEGEPFLAQLDGRAGTIEAQLVDEFIESGELGDHQLDMLFGVDVSSAYDETQPGYTDLDNLRHSVEEAVVMAMVEKVLAKLSD
jgi:hypothetical protein